MPQPLSQVHPTLGHVLASGNTPHTPEMSAAILGVINLWAQLDYNYGTLVARVAKADPVTVTGVFQAMISGEARKTALIAAVNEKLTPEEASLITAVIESNTPSRKTRNMFAYNLWGSLNTRPDCVVLVSPKTLAKTNAAMTTWQGQGPTPELERSEIMVWRQPDFDTALTPARTAHDRVVQLSFMFDHPAADRRRSGLLVDRQIARLYEYYLRENTP